MCGVVKFVKYGVIARDAPLSNITACLMIGVDVENIVLNNSGVNIELFVGL
jgi:hypothetical protein